MARSLLEAIKLCEQPVVTIDDSKATDAIEEGYIFLKSVKVKIIKMPALTSKDYIWLSDESDKRKNKTTHLSSFKIKELFKLIKASQKK